MTRLLQHLAMSLILIGCNNSDQDTAGEASSSTTSAFCVEPEFSGTGGELAFSFCGCSDEGAWWERCGPESDYLCKRNVLIDENDDVQVLGSTCLPWCTTTADCPPSPLEGYVVECWRVCEIQCIDNTCPAGWSCQSGACLHNLMPGT